MSKKKMHSIQDYVESTKKDNSKEPFPYFDPFDALLPSGLELAIIVGIIVFGIIATLLFVH